MASLTKPAVTFAVLSLVSFGCFVVAPAAAQDAAELAKSPAYKKAVESRSAENPNLVWTASQVALVAKEVSPNV